VRAAALIAVLTAAAVLAGTAWAGVDPNDPQQRHTAADTKLAQSLALRAGDLTAGWKAEKEQTGPGPACVGEPDESALVQTAKIDPSFVWSDNLTRLGSEVDVFQTAAMARQDWDLSTLKLATSCLLQDASAEFGKSAHVTIASSKTLARPGHAERSLHYRLVLSVRAAQTVRLVADVLALGRGRITVVLHSLTLTTTPLPAAGLTQLATKLAGRLDGGGIGI
jgi:hypothetical protein